jgi:cell division control protein 7
MNAQPPALGACLHTSATPDHPHGRIKPKTEYDIQQVTNNQKEARKRSLWASDKVGYPDKDTRLEISL